jgi:hypothetical protein
VIGSGGDGVALCESERERVDERLRWPRNKW